MSDAGKKLDVEDVLSSIRRLVSEETRAGTSLKTATSRGTRTPPQVSQNTPEQAPEKLILTPSLRVQNPPPAASAQMEMEQRISDIESLVISEATAPEHDADKTPAPTKAALNFAEPPLTRTQQEPEQQTQEPASAPSSTQDSTAYEPPMTAHRSEEIQQAESSVKQTETADASPNQMIVSEESVAFPQEPIMKLAETSAVNSTGEQMPETDHTNTSQDSPFIARANTPASPPESDDAPQEEQAAAENVSSSEPLQSESAETRVTDHVSDRSNQIDFTENDGAILDEDALREMVADMVRSELQGELGDRITRNVRKLVRREIYRAVASKDFE